MSYRPISEFLPKNPIEGRRGFYPVSKNEWRNLPLPLRCSTWDPRVAAVVFETFLPNYGFSVKIDVHPQNVFKALFILSQGDTLLYSVIGVRWHDGTVSFAKWWQDKITGCFRITSINGDVYGTQGGFQGYVPENCYLDETTWCLNTCAKLDNGFIAHWS